MRAGKCGALVLVLALGFCGHALALDASQIQRSEETMQQERVLREKLEEEKIFVKEIAVEGINLISVDELAQKVAPFQGHWLTKKDIQRLLGTVKAAYVQKGYSADQIGISYRLIKNTQLVISVKEPATKPR